MKRRKHKKNMKGGIIIGLISTIGVVGWIRSIVLGKAFEEQDKAWKTDKELLNTYRSFIHLWKRPLKGLANDETRYEAFYHMWGKDSNEVLKEVCDWYNEDYDDVKPE